MSNILQLGQTSDLSDLAAPYTPWQRSSPTLHAPPCKAQERNTQLDHVPPAPSGWIQPDSEDHSGAETMYGTSDDSSETSDASETSDDSVSEDSVP